MRKDLVLALLATCALFTACKKEEKALPIPYTSLTTTTNYFNTFKGADSATSVSLTEQTLRLKMLDEVEQLMLSFNSIPIDAARLKQMLENTNDRFSDSTLKATTGNSIMSVFAQSFITGRTTEVNRLNAWCDTLQNIGVSAHTPAAAGVAGNLGGGAYLVDAKAVEYTQLIKTAIVGGMMLDQICNVALGTAKMSADNTAPVSGKNYTALAHNWDEAYGYLTRNDYYPKATNMGLWLEVYLGNYVRQVKGVYGDPTALYLAYLKGRAAIVNKDNAARDGQITAIRHSLERSVATVAVSYLNKSLNAFSEATRFHTLSEGVGMIYALRYAHNAKLTPARSDELMKKLMDKPNGFWSLNNADIEAVRNEIATLYVVDRDAVVNP